jgi:hypothetical protein
LKLAQHPKAKPGTRQKPKGETLDKGEALE